MTKINIGEKYGMLRVLEKKEDIQKDNLWKCKCDCGNNYIASTERLINASLPNCGCANGVNLSSSSCQKELGISSTNLNEIKFRLGIKGQIRERDYEQIKVIVHDIFERYGYCTLHSINLWWQTRQHKIKN